MTLPAPAEPRAAAHATPLDTLSHVFGYAAFRGQQKAIIDRVIEGGDAFVLMPTGGGKSVCYQVPALHRPGVAVVVSPLISLMKDQVDALAQLGVRASVLNSSLPGEQIARVTRSVRGGELDLLYVSPEWFVMESFQDLLGSIHVALVAVDEAHCVSQWGHDLRPDYVALGPARERLAAIPFMALTATADEATRRDIVTQLRLSDPAVFVVTCLAARSPGVPGGLECMSSWLYVRQLCDNHNQKGGRHDHMGGDWTAASCRPHRLRHLAG